MLRNYSSRRLGDDRIFFQTDNKYLLFKFLRWVLANILTNFGTLILFNILDLQRWSHSLNQTTGFTARTYSKGLSIKEVRSQGSCPVQTFCGQWGSSDADVFTPWCKKKFMVCPHGQRGLSQYGYFSDKGGGVNFSRFCADVFYR